MLFYCSKFFICLLFLSNKQADEFNPFRLSQRSHFLISQVRNQKYSDFTHRIISATLERGDKNDIRIHTHDHFIIKITFNSYFGSLTRLQALIHFFVEQVACTGYTHHLIAGFQFDEIG